jgi:polyphosphate kinase
MDKRDTPTGISKKKYRKRLRKLQIELVKLQKHLIQHGHKLLIVMEGRDAAGKDGTIKRIVRHLSPRETRIFAPGKPSDRDRSSWYFQRFVPHLPAGEEMVIFNRSWYNRAGVEHVMGFCTEAEYEEFFETVTEFEHMLTRSGIHLFKYYLDISRDEQARRLEARRRDPLKQWKISPIDDKALEFWEAYSRARDTMFRRTHQPGVPWTVVRADSKRTARVHLIANLLGRLGYPDKKPSVCVADEDVVFDYDESHLRNGRISR